MALDLYRYDASCADKSLFVGSRDPSLVCPWCGGSDCLNAAVHWTAETSAEVTAEVVSDD